jgi:hypothetical protein
MSRKVLKERLQNAQGVDDALMKLLYGTIGLIELHYEPLEDLKDGPPDMGYKLF